MDNHIVIRLDLSDDQVDHVLQSVPGASDGLSIGYPPYRQSQRAARKRMAEKILRDKMLLMTIEQIGTLRVTE